MKKLLLLTVIVFGLHAESVTALKKACKYLGDLYYTGNDVKKDYNSFHISRYGMNSSWIVWM